MIVIFIEESLIIRTKINVLWEHHV